jgi:hypothetical protein
MPVFNMLGWPLIIPDQRPRRRPQPLEGKGRGITKSPKRAKRRNRRKP